ncbi:MAG: hypothetical protein RID91_02420, partial [Azospirillaceae bacterium]
MPSPTRHSSPTDTARAAFRRPRSSVAAAALCGVAAIALGACGLPSRVVDGATYAGDIEPTVPRPERPAAGTPALAELDAVAGGEAEPAP